jgi:cytoskeletal protein RodZ
MKRCSICRKIYPDETMYCLDDGNPLAVVFEIAEEPTIVKNDWQIPPAMPSTKQSGNSTILYVLAGIFGLLVLLGGAGVAAVMFMMPRNDSSNHTSVTAKKETGSPFSNTAETKTKNEAAPTPTSDPEKERIEKEKADLKKEQDSLEKERKRLEDERKKLEEKKKTSADEIKTTTTTTATRPPPQPTTRIKFSRGSASQTVSGRIGSERSFVLEARSGQYLSASVGSGGGCVTFRGGGASTGFTTSSGDNRITLVNNCSSESSFTLTVAIR